MRIHKIPNEIDFQTYFYESRLRFELVFWYIIHIVVCQPSYTCFGLGETECELFNINQHLNYGGYRSKDGTRLDLRNPESGLLKLSA